MTFEPEIQISTNNIPRIVFLPFLRRELRCKNVCGQSVPEKPQLRPLFPPTTLISLAPVTQTMRSQPFRLSFHFFSDEKELVKIRRSSFSNICSLMFRFAGCEKSKGSDLSSLINLLASSQKVVNAECNLSYLSLSDFLQPTAHLYPGLFHVFSATIALPCSEN